MGANDIGQMRPAILTTHVNARVWSEEDFQYHEWRWVIPNTQPVPRSEPPMIYIDRVNTY